MKLPSLSEQHLLTIIEGHQFIKAGPLCEEYHTTYLVEMPRPSLAAFINRLVNAGLIGRYFKSGEDKRSPYYFATSLGVKMSKIIKQLANL